MRPAETTRIWGRQRGAAAIEFALVFLLFISLLYGIATFGAVFYTQQVVARAAEDGARAISVLGSASVVTNDSRVSDVVYNSLAASLIAPVTSTNQAQRKTWVSNSQNVVVTTADSTCSGTVSCMKVTVQYQYSRNSVLPTSSLITWALPNTLTASAHAAK